MSLLEKLPESVRDSELETDLRDDYTVHTYREAPQRAAPPREEFWQRTTRIGQGGFGVVWLESCVRGQGVDGPKLRAVKEIKTHNSSALSYSRELDAFTKFSQRKYNTSFVISFGWFRSSRAVFLALEYLPLGDLHSFIREHPALAEIDVQEVTFQVLQGLRLMHQEGFAHRDLKPANILLKSCPPDHWWIKLSDFGLSKRINQHGQTSASLQMGTVGFLAPEILWPTEEVSAATGDETSDQIPLKAMSADIWSLGEVTFQMFSGLTATFKHEGQLYEYYKGNRELPRNLIQERGAGAAAIDFIAQIMVADYKKRPTALTALAHEWMKGKRALPDTTPDVEAEKPQQSGPEVTSSVGESLAYGAWTTPVGTKSPPAVNWDAAKQLRRKPVAGLLQKSRVNNPTITAVVPLTTGRLLDNNIEITGTSLDADLAEREPISSVDVSPADQQIQNITEQHGREDASQKLYSFARINLADEKAPRTHNFVEHGSPISLLAFSPDCKWLVVVSRGSIELWDLETMKAEVTWSLETGIVTCVALSMDSQWIVGGSEDCNVVMLNREENTSFRKFSGHGDRVSCVSFSPDDRLIASASDNESICLWSRMTGGDVVAVSWVHTLGRKKTLPSTKGHRSPIIWVAFLNDTSLASVSANGVICIWNTAAKEHLQSKIRLDVSNVSHVAMAPNGRFIAAAAGNKVARVEIYNHEQGDLKMRRRECLSYEKGVMALSMLGNGGEMLVTAFQDGTMQARDLSTGRTTTDFGGYGTPTGPVVFSLDQHVAYVLKYQTILTCDWRTLTLSLALRQHFELPGSVAVSPDGKIAVSVSRHLDPQSADPSIVIWDIESSAVLEFSRTPADKAMMFSRDSQLLATISSSSAANIYSPKVKADVTRIGGTTKLGRIRFAAYSTDLRYLATVQLRDDYRRLPRLSQDREWELRLWDVTTGSSICRFRMQSDEIQGVVFSPDSSMLALLYYNPDMAEFPYHSRGSQPHIGLYKVTSGKLTSFFSLSPGDWTLQIHMKEKDPTRFPDAGSDPSSSTPTIDKEPRGNLHFSSDSERIALVHRSNEVLIWELKSKSCIMARREGNASPPALPNLMRVVSPDLKRLVAVSSTGELEIRDVALDKKLIALRNQREFKKVVFSPSSHIMLAMLDERVITYNIDTDSAIAEYICDGEISDIAFLPDSERFITRSKGRMLLWHLDRTTPVKEYKAPVLQT